MIQLSCIKIYYTSPFLLRWNIQCLWRVGKFLVFWSTSTWSTFSELTRPAFGSNPGEEKKILRKSLRCERWFVLVGKKKNKLTADAGVDEMLWWECVHGLLVNFKGHIGSIFLFFFQALAVIQREETLSFISRWNTLGCGSALWCFPSLASNACWRHSMPACIRIDKPKATAALVSQSRTRHWSVKSRSVLSCLAVKTACVLLYHTFQWLWMQQLIQFNNYTYCPDVSHI